MTSPELTADLERLVMQALETPYSSFSATDDSETGNRYQAVGLGDRSTRGMREDRGRFLDALDLRGRTVLDLGSNLGEISREARARGAALVDGFEIDPYFNEIAQLVNVLTGTTRVSFYERDMADPATYSEPYDVVLAFSAFRFIADRLDRLAAVTDVMVVETHELKGNFDERYLVPLTEHFPAFRMLGESDVERLRAGGVRAVGVFARDEAALLGALAPELRSGGRAAGVLAAGVRGQRIRGAVDELRLDDGRLRISGWCRDAETLHDAVELSTPAHGPGGAPFGTLAVTEPTADGGVRGRLRGAAGGRSGRCASTCRRSPGRPARHDVGLLVARPGAGAGPGPDGRPRPARSRSGATGRWTRSSPRSTWIPRLEPFLASLVPNARVSLGAGRRRLRPRGRARGEHDEAPSRRAARASPARAPYVALSVLGELARRFGEPGLGRDDLIGLCAPRFDVMTYVEGGVAGPPRPDRPAAPARAPD